MSEPTAKDKNTAPSGPQPEAKGSLHTARFADRQLNFLLLINAAILITGTVLAGADFIGLYNLQSMAAQIPELGLLALGVMLAMISGNGGIDLSGIALANLSGMVAGLLTALVISPDNAPFAFTLLFIGIAVAVVIGLSVASHQHSSTPSVIWRLSAAVGAPFSSSSFLGTR